jgi:hypothetical protein
MSEYNQKKVINSCQKAHDTLIHLFDGQSSIKRKIRALCRTRVLVEQTFGILREDSMCYTKSVIYMSTYMHINNK